MKDGFQVIAEAVGNQEETVKLVERLFDVARPSAVFGEPVVSGDYTVITASEVSIGMGAGFAIGGGPASAPRGQEGEMTGGFSGGGGGGGGGGGASSARPVAVISIGPEGVRVEPVVDVTKTILAFFTMLGSVFMIGAKIRKARRG